MITIGIAAALAVGGAAQDYGYTQIAAGNLPLAERQLASVRVVEPGEPSAMINLAAVYARTGRPAEAQALYREALAAQNVQLELGSGAPAWSHDLAQRGLDRMQRMAAR